MGRPIEIAALTLLTAALVGCGSTPDSGRGGSGGAGPSTGDGAGGSGSGGDPATTSSTGGSGGGGAKPDPTGTFVAVGAGGRRIRSTDDGVTWTDDLSLGGAPDPAKDLRAITFGQGLFVAAGYRVMTSSDGAAWDDKPPVAEQPWIGQLAFGDGLYVGLGGDGSRVSSPDGKTFTQHEIDTTSSSANGAIAFAPHHGFVSVNDDGKISHSDDGKAWELTKAAIGTNGYAVAYGNGLFVAIGGGGVIHSPDGVHWSSYAAFNGGGLRALVFAEEHFTAMISGAVYTSNDGDFWVEHEAADLALDACAFGHGTYVAFEGTRVRRSTNGVAWSAPVDLAGTTPLTAVTFGPDGP